MLVLTRKVNESIVIGGDVRVTIVAINGEQVRVGIDAPREVPIVRDELERRPGAGGRRREVPGACPDGG